VSLINVVLFDLGNVIAHIDFDEFWRSLKLVDPEKRIPFAQEYKDLTRKYETGLLPSEEYLQNLFDLFRRQYTIPQLKQAVESIIEEPMEGMLEIVQKVSVQCQTALVSNTNELHYNSSLSKFESLHLLHKHYCSYKLQVMKPAAGFYDAIVRDLNIDPAEMLFVDDLQENVNGAFEAGMQGVKFESVQQLQTSLKGYRIL
jgi:glucose-1-phosphatase